MIGNLSESTNDAGDGSPHDVHSINRDSKLQMKSAPQQSEYAEYPNAKKTESVNNSFIREQEQEQVTSYNNVQ